MRQNVDRDANVLYCVQVILKSKNLKLRMSREDLEAMRPYKNAIDSAARATGTKPHILAGKTKKI